MAKNLFSELAMAKYIRTPGGERNSNTGKNWSKEELKLVLKLYLYLKEEAYDNQPKIHEHNIDIQKLGDYLNRTTRSVESQMLMFRCLDRHKNYSRKNYSKLCEVLWIEYLEATIKDK